MNDGSQAVAFIYLIGCLILVGSAVAVRRIPLRRSVGMALAWVLVFVAGFGAFALKDDFRDLGGRLVDEARGRPTLVADGAALRVRQSSDGHYWVTGALNGQETRFLVDSGATITSISSATAARAGIRTGDALPASVETANGRLIVQPGRAQSLKVGPIERDNLEVHVSDGFGDTNVLGMNFLSSLSAWGVEGHWLVLRP